ncbi:MAG: ribonuclease HI, partial [Bacteroidia bacterium]|nr:ribonuclease HI [Bacteroidia bacterium]
DGASLGNPGPGGYGVVLISGKYRKELSAGYKLTTNNRMELMAVIAGLKALKKEGLAVTIYTDSQYIVNAITKNWVWGWEKTNFKNKKNPDLWKELLAEYRKHQVNIQWIKGHNGNPENERCDYLATTAAKENPELEDTGYQPEN